MLKNVVYGGVFHQKEINASLNQNPNPGVIFPAFLCNSESEFVFIFKETMIRTKLENITILQTFSCDFLRGLI